MLRQTREKDGNLSKLDCGNGAVWISNKLNGRIFCSLGSEMVHQFRADLAANPDPVEFNNIGGNSLWPAPEGGPLAYNYRPDGKWVVQDAINRQPTVTTAQEPGFASVAKDMQLVNREGRSIAMRFERSVFTGDIRDLLSEYQLLGLSYRTEEALTPLAEYRTDEAIAAAWSLEQLPGADGIIAFGRVGGDAAGCINDDFYGNPHPRLSYHGNGFRFELGGPERLQIGIKASSRPELIGSYDAKRGIVVIRTTPPRTDGRYINIADNDQPGGIYSAADQFSIFNGAELGFHELETIAPMNSENGILTGSRLESTTMIFKGSGEHLRRCLREHFGIDFL
jgi:hypothetical protein